MVSVGSNQIASGLGLFGLPGHWEIIIVVLAILLLFGGKKLPELARGLARGLRSFKEEMKGISSDLEEESEAEDKPRAEEQGPAEQETAPEHRNQTKQ